MVRVLSFPFRLSPDGGIATVDLGSDTEIDEAIGIAVLTRPGERITVPTFGIADPAFVGFEAGALQRHLIDFGPDVVVTVTTTSRTAQASEELRIDWAREESGDVISEAP